MSDDYDLQARQWFADANGWRIAGHSFSLATLARNGVHGGCDYNGHNVVDHPEYYRKDRRAVAIVGHNYHGDCGTHYGTENITRLAATYGLIVHVAPAGKAASWYYPNATMLLIITRPGIAIVWPTDEQMAASATAHAEYVARSREPARGR